jgi:hypothetical protein
MAARTLLATDAKRILNELIRERQTLVRMRDGDPALIEANRLAIAYWHRQLHERGRDSVG